eukprot:2481103-Prymnesium_polylepis.2
MPAGALLWAWDADPQFDEKAGEQCGSFYFQRSGTGTCNIRGGSTRVSLCSREPPAQPPSSRGWMRVKRRRRIGRVRRTWMWIRGMRRAMSADLHGCIDFDGFRHLLCWHGLDPDLETCIDVLATVCT